MDVFGGFRNIKTEKANAMVKYKRIQRLKAMFRLLEFCVFLIILSRFTTYLPSVFKLSSDYFRGLSVTAVNPLFVFFIGNSIVLTLLLKSGGTQSKDHPDRSTNPINDLYEEYAKNSKKKSPEIKKQRNCTAGGETLLCSSDVASTLAVVKEKKFCRSRSDHLKRLHHHKEGGCRELRRSVTVAERRQQPQKNIVAEAGKEKEWCPEEEMSNEEFRKTIEAFIARQQRALREDPDYSSDFSLENS